MGQWIGASPHSGRGKKRAPAAWLGRQVEGMETPEGWDDPSPTLTAKDGRTCALAHRSRSVGGRGLAFGHVAQAVGVGDDDDAGGDADDALALPFAEAFVDALARAADHGAELALGKPHVKAHLPVAETRRPATRSSVLASR